MDHKLLEWIRNNTGKWISSPRPRAKRFMVTTLDMKKETVRIKFEGSIYPALPLHFWMFERTLDHLSKDKQTSQPLSAKVSPPYMNGSIEEAIWRQPFPKINTEYKTSPHVCDILYYAGFIDYRPSRNPETNRKVQGAILRSSIQPIVPSKITKTSVPLSKPPPETPTNDLGQTGVLEKLSKQEILRWAKKYDEDHPWRTTKEKEIGDRIRAEAEFGLDTLKEIVEWKFKTVPLRIVRINNLLKQYNDQEIRAITRKALPLETQNDNRRINILREVKGIGVSLASAILTFQNPSEYCIYDIHVMREMYGELPKYPFTQNKHYLKLLQDLREESTQKHLHVRTIEKALFKKNLDS